MQKNKWFWIGGIAALAAVLIAVVINQSNKNKAQNSKIVSGNQATLDGTNPAATSSEEDVETEENQESSSTPAAASATSKKTAPAPSQAYTQAVAQYGAKGYRLQFVDCHGAPGYLSIKKGAQFMLDNRDGVSHTIIVKSQTFRIPAYGFTIVTARDVGTYNITCDAGGAAQLNVEM